MINANPLATRSATRHCALFALACAFALTLASVPALQAVELAVLQPLADKVPALPLTGTFEKMTGGSAAPFVLKLKNDSKETLKVSGKVLLAVVHHAMDKARALPEQTIEAGHVWTIKDLSADDKVILTAPGFAPLELSVPFKL